MMALLLVAAQFEHVAQHGDLAALQLSEQVEGGDGRVWARIIRIVKQRRIVNPGNRQQAQRFANRQTIRDLVPREPFDEAHGSGTQRSVDAMPADQREMGVDLPCLSLRSTIVEPAAHPL